MLLLMENSSLAMIFSAFSLRIQKKVVTLHEYEAKSIAFHINFTHVV